MTNDRHLKVLVNVIYDEKGLWVSCLVRYGQDVGNLISLTKSLDWFSPQVRFFENSPFLTPIRLALSAFTMFDVSELNARLFLDKLVDWLVVFAMSGI